MCPTSLDLSILVGQDKIYFTFPAAGNALRISFT